MEEKLYLNKNYFDMQRGKHRAVEVIKSDTNSVLLKTEEGKMLKICDDIKKLALYNERLEWLEAISNRSDLSDYVVLPTKRLTGLKYGEFGYVCELEQDVNLNYYVKPMKGEKLFKWYYDKTGGLEYRLQIGYNIAVALENIHELGYCLVDVCPENTTITKYNADEKKPPAIQFIGADNICSYTYHPLIAGSDMYCDPLVYLNRTGNSISSDTYSYAIMLFELLTTCHPFVGADCEDLSEDEIIKKVNSGTLDYIDDWDVDSNKNEDYEDTQLFVSNELENLFYKMFVKGKLDTSQRPALSEFRKACLKSMQKIIKCTHTGCERDYPYNVAKNCPFCNYPTENVLVAKVKKITSSTEELLLPYDNLKKFTSLPEVEEMVGFMIIKQGLNKLPKSFFAPLIDSDSGATGIWIQYSPEKGKYIIRNRFKKIKLKTKDKLLEPFVNKEFAAMSDCEFPNYSETTIEFPANALLESEDLVEINCKEYGNIKYKWILTIGKE